MTWVKRVVGGGSEREKREFFRGTCVAKPSFPVFTLRTEFETKSVFRLFHRLAKASPHRTTRIRFKATSPRRITPPIRKSWQITGPHRGWATGTEEQNLSAPVPHPSSLERLGRYLNFAGHSTKGFQTVLVSFFSFRNSFVGANAVSASRRNDF